MNVDDVDLNQVVLSYFDKLAGEEPEWPPRPQGQPQPQEEIKEEIKEAAPEQEEQSALETSEQQKEKITRMKTIMT